MKKNLFVLLALFEIPFIFILYILNLVNDNKPFYNYIGLIFLVIWIVIIFFIIYEKNSANELISPIIIYIFTLSIFIFFLLIFDNKQDIIFRFYPYEYKTERNLVKALTIIIFSTLAFYLGSKLVRFKKYTKSKINSYIDNKKMLMTINLIIFFIVVLVDFKLSKNEFGTIFGRVANDYSSSSKLSILRLLFCLYPMVIINFYYIFLKHKLGKLDKIVVISIISFVILWNFKGGNRAFILSAVIGCIALYYKKNGIKLKQIIIVVLMGIFIYQSFISLQYYRVNKNEFKYNNVSLHEKVWKYDTLDVSMLVASRYPDVEEFSMGNSVKSLILNFIPRKYYKNKPLPFGKQLGIMVNPQDPNTVSSYAAITPIEFYSNFGFIITMVIMVLFGGILQKIYYKYGYGKGIDIDSLVYVNFISILYITIRGDFTTKTINLFIPLIIFYLIKYVVFYLYTKIKIR